MSEMYPIDPNASVHPIRSGELQPNLDQLPGRIGVLHDVRVDRVVDPPITYTWAAADTTSSGCCYVETTGDQLPPAAYLEDAAREPNAELLRVEACIRQEQADQQEVEASIWHSRALALLDRASTLPAQEAAAMCAGAFICSLRTTDYGERVHFLQEVYARGLAEQMADACAEPRLAYIMDTEWMGEDGRSHAAVTVYIIARAALMFRLGNTDFDRYIQRAVLDGPPAPSGGRSWARAIQQQIVSKARQGIFDSATSEAAAAASTEVDIIWGAPFDPTKVERFALEQIVVSEQKAEILGENLADTPLARTLRDSRGTAVERREWSDDPDIVAIEELQEHLVQAYITLSRPVVQRFSAAEVDTPAYMVTQRFRELKTRLMQYYLIAEHIAPPRVVREWLQSEATMRQVVEEESRPSNTRLEVWSVAASGGGVPRVVADVLTNIVVGVKNNPGLGKVSAEELLLFAHECRQELLAFATRHLSDFPANLTFDDVKMVRNEQGKLMLEGDRDIPPKGSWEQYASVSLGCLALRERIVPNAALSPWARALLGNANYVDHLLAIAFNEAYERGIFHTVATA